MSEYWNETVRRVGPTSQGGTFVEVCPTGLSCVGIYTTNDASSDYFGKVAIEWSPDFARQVAKAILACCDEMDAAK